MNSTVKNEERERDIEILTSIKAGLAYIDDLKENIDELNGEISSKNNFIKQKHEQIEGLSKEVLENEKKLESYRKDYNNKVSLIYDEKEELKKLVSRKPKEASKKPLIILCSLVGITILTILIYFISSNKLFNNIVKYFLLSVISIFLIVLIPLGIRSIKNKNKNYKDEHESKIRNKESHISHLEQAKKNTLLLIEMQENYIPTLVLENEKKEKRILDCIERTKCEIRLLEIERDRITNEANMIMDKLIEEYGNHNGFAYTKWNILDYVFDLVYSNRSYTIDKALIKYDTDQWRERQMEVSRENSMRIADAVKKVGENINATINKGVDSINQSIENSTSKLTYVMKSGIIHLSGLINESIEASYEAIRASREAAEASYQAISHNNEFNSRLVELSEKANRSSEKIVYDIESICRKNGIPY